VAFPIFYHDLIVSPFLSLLPEANFNPTLRWCKLQNYCKEMLCNGKALLLALEAKKHYKKKKKCCPVSFGLVSLVQNGTKLRRLKDIKFFELSVV
jgi:hypothetical protein